MIDCGSRKGAFTLIELLIVIAIILILVAIALPNFLEAQLRAKVAKTKAELRTLKTAMEEYYLDWRIYPPETEHDDQGTEPSDKGLFWLTSPVKYIASVPYDSFSEDRADQTRVVYKSGGAEATELLHSCGRCMLTWVIFSHGPGRSEGDLRTRDPHFRAYAPNRCIESYAATNGSRSSGDIFVWGGDSFWIGVHSSEAYKPYYRRGSMDTGLCVDGRIYLHHMPPDW